MAIHSTAALLALLALCARPAGAQVQAQAQVSSPEADFSVSSFTVMVLDSAPEVKSAREAYENTRDAYKIAVANMLLPQISGSIQAYPYGDNPTNDYQFQTWQLARDQTTLNTSVDLNLFNSFQDYEKVRAAKLAYEAAERQYFAARQDKAFAAIQAFYGLDAQLELTDVARQNLAAQQDQYTQSQDLYNNGMKSLADLLKSETDWRSSQLRLIDAQTDEARARMAFNVLIDRPGLEHQTLTVDLKTGTTVLPSLDADLAEALEGRPETVRARKNLELAHVTLQQAWQGIFPDIRLDATWAHQDQATFGVSNASLGIPNHQYYLGLSMALPAGFNVLSQVYGLAEAKAGLRSAQADVVAAERQVRSDVYGAYLSLDHDTQSYGLALQKEDIARRTLDLVKEQYQQDTADAIRMNQAQSDFLDAQVARTQAQHQIFIDRAQYKRAVGEPLW